MRQISDNKRKFIYIYTNSVHYELLKAKCLINYYSIELTRPEIQSQNLSRRGKSWGNNFCVVCLLNGCHLKLFLIILCTLIWSILSSRAIHLVLVCEFAKTASLTSAILLRVG